MNEYPLEEQKETCRTFHVRIKTRRGIAPYIALSYGVYGDYAVYFLTEYMQVFEPASIESWVYSTVISTAKLEFGEWVVQGASQTAQFGDLSINQTALLELQF